MASIIDTAGAMEQLAPQNIVKPVNTITDKGIAGAGTLAKPISINTTGAMQQIAPQTTNINANYQTAQAMEYAAPQQPFAQPGTINTTGAMEMIAPQNTAVQNATQILDAGKQPPVETTKTTTTKPTGTTSGSGVSTGGATTTTTTDGAPTTSSAGTATASAKLFEQVQNMKFDYNPETDEEYRMAASQMENEVAQMMVGRGGLYSSVTASAYQARLATLRVDMTKQAYDRFLTERDYTLKMASFAADREDAAFSQQMQLAQFNAQREDEMFNRKMQQAQLSIQRANAAYNRQRAEAAQKQADAENQLGMMRADYYKNTQEYNAMVSKWREEGAADYEIAKYFNVPLGAEVSSPNYGENRITQGLYNLERQAQEIVAYSKATNDAKTYLNTLESFYEDGTTTTQSNTASYASAYTTAYSKANAAANATGGSWSQVYDTYSANADALIGTMGESNYLKLMNNIADKIE